MRFGLIGDVHAEDELLHFTLDALVRVHKCDRVLCTGDIVDGLGDVDRACELLTKANALIIRGNHDRWIRSDEMRTLPLAHKMTDLKTETIALLKTLPPTLSMEIPPPFGGTLLLCHGVGPNDMCRLTPDDYGYAISSNDDLLKVLFDSNISMMIGGHTHKPMLRRFERGGGKRPLIVVNPGTLARESEPGFAIVDFATLRVDFHRLIDGLSGRTAQASSVGF